MPGRTTEGMSWPAPGEEPVFKTIKLDDDVTANRAAQLWIREKEAKVRVGVWIWWTDRSRSDDGRVGAAAVCKHGNELRTHRSYPGTERIVVFEAELWAIGLTLSETIRKKEPLQRNGVKTVAIFSDTQAAIRWTAISEMDQSEGVNPPYPRHHNRDSLDRRVLRYPGKQRSRPPGKLSLRCQRKHDNRAAIHLGFELS